MLATRRAILTGTASSLACSGFIPTATAWAASGAGAGPTPRPTDNLKSVEAFGTGAGRCEGIVIDSAGCAYATGEHGAVYKAEPDGVIRVIARLPSGATSGGVTLDRKGNLICCNGGHHAVMRVSPSGIVSQVADHVGSVAFNHPNFPTFDAEGNLYISNSTHFPDTASAIRGGEFTSAQPNGALVRIRPNGKGDVVATGLSWANGTAIDPREEAIFVLQSTKRNCVRIPLRKNGTFGAPEVFAENFPGMPDGMAFAEDGTLFVTIPISMGTPMVVLNQVLKVEKDGSWSTFLVDPGGSKLALPTNCAFGGPGHRDLYIANSQGDHFSRIRTSYVGHRLYHQR
jgi:gluconolactonase